MYILHVRAYFVRSQKSHKSDRKPQSFNLFATTNTQFDIMKPFRGKLIRM